MIHFLELSCPQHQSLPPSVRRALVNVRYPNTQKLHVISYKVKPHILIKGVYILRNSWKWVLNEKIFMWEVPLFHKANLAPASSSTLDTLLASETVQTLHRACWTMVVQRLTMKKMLFFSVCFWILFKILSYIIFFIQRGSLYFHNAYNVSSVFTSNSPLLLSCLLSLFSSIVNPPFSLMWSLPSPGFYMQTKACHNWCISVNLAAVLEFLGITFG